ncbi:hypothetical protein MLD38_007657 [Melastoma candidum]|uniref:Uncharacterized protein n=1 Tax=Melastoma candidum TaxID=119954 RepID=A0ACB9RRI3_9MYRT|nr:hypothetical protein MLD38_007657 [Melastoma candidum]
MASAKQEYASRDNIHTSDIVIDHCIFLPPLLTHADAHGNFCSRRAVGVSSLLLFYSLNNAYTHLVNGAKANKKGGKRQFNVLVDVYEENHPI